AGHLLPDHGGDAARVRRSRTVVRAPAVQWGRFAWIEGQRGGWDRLLRPYRGLRVRGADGSAVLPEGTVRGPPAAGEARPAGRPALTLGPQASTSALGPGLTGTGARLGPWAE